MESKKNLSSNEIQHVMKSILYGCNYLLPFCLESSLNYNNTYYSINLPSLWCFKLYFSFNLLWWNDSILRKSLIKSANLKVILSLFRMKKLISKQIFLDWVIVILQNSNGNHLVFAYFLSLLLSKTYLVPIYDHKKKSKQTNAKIKT